MLEPIIEKNSDGGALVSAPDEYWNDLLHHEVLSASPRYEAAVRHLAFAAMDEAKGPVRAECAQILGQLREMAISTFRFTSSYETVDAAVTADLRERQDDLSILDPLHYELHQALK